MVVGIGVVGAIVAAVATWEHENEQAFEQVLMQSADGCDLEVQAFLI